MAAILEKIDTLFEENEGLFSKMEASKEARPRYCSLKCNGIDPCDLDKETPPKIVATVTEFEQPKDWPAFRDAWRFTSPLRKDFRKYIGGENLRWDASSWDDIKKLNKGIREAAQEYFEDHAEKASTELDKFLANIEIINADLKHMQEQVIGKSRLTEIRSELEQALKRVNDLMIRYQSHLRCEGLFQNSVILEADHQHLLSSWYPGAWVSIYQGTRHGMNGAAFHAQVDGTGPTITLIKYAGNIFGCYLQLPWPKSQSSQWVNDAAASVLLVKSASGIKPQQLRCIQAQHAGYHHPTYGPTFGANHDITCFPNGGQSYSNIGNTYENNTGKNNYVLVGCQGQNFNPEEIEVFAQV